MPRRPKRFVAPLAGLVCVMCAAVFVGCGGSSVEVVPWHWASVVRSRGGDAQFFYVTWADQDVRSAKAIGRGGRTVVTLYSDWSGVSTLLALPHCVSLRLPTHLASLTFVDGKPMRQGDLSLLPQFRDRLRKFQTAVRSGQERCRTIPLR
jgi:hypothetical protein